MIRRRIEFALTDAGRGLLSEAPTTISGRAAPAARKAVVESPAANRTCNWLSPEHAFQAVDPVSGVRQDDGLLRGELVALGFALVLPGGNSFFRGNFILPAPDGTIQRVALIVALTSFGAAWLLEDAYRALNRRVSQRLESAGAGDAEKPGVPAPSNRGYVSSDGSHTTTKMHSLSGPPSEER